MKLETIILQQPNIEGGVALMTALKNRRSDRKFSTENISLEHLSGMLWAAYGVNREDGRRTVPSALNLHPLSIYAVLPEGIYLYDAQKHVLEPQVEGDYRELTGNAYVKEAPLNLVIFADYSKYMNFKMGIPAIDATVRPNMERWICIDAGHCTQSVHLYCASEGLKTIVRGLINEPALKELLGLGEEQHFIIAQTVGY